MKLRLERYGFYQDTTLGVLFIDNVFDAYTLEDKTREQKIAAQTAIPKGTYDIIITHSSRFGRRLPLLNRVPGFDGIRIHSGNSNQDTKGCLLVGEVVRKKKIYNSRKAFERLFTRLEDAIGRGEKISIEITDYQLEKKKMNAGRKALFAIGGSAFLFGVLQFIKNRKRL